MLKKFLSFIVIMFVSSTTSSLDSNPSILDFSLNSKINSVENTCKSLHGSFRIIKEKVDTNNKSYPAVFACIAPRNHVLFESNSNGFIYSIVFTQLDDFIYFSELKRFKNRNEKLYTAKVGANSTLIYEFVDKNWAAIFSNFGINGNYRIHLYNTQELLRK